MGVPIRRITVFWGPYWGPLIFGKLQYKDSRAIIYWQVCTHLHYDGDDLLAGYHLTPESIRAMMTMSPATNLMRAAKSAELLLNWALSGPKSWNRCSG